MKNTGYKRLFKLALALALTGCAGNPAVKTDAPYPNNTATIHDHAPEYQTQSLGLTGTYANSLAVQNFIRHMVLEHHFSESYLNSLFSKAKRLDYVIRLENPPPDFGPKPAHPKSGGWTRYRQQFITEAHINNGVAFWSNNADAIQKASVTYGVDPEYIVAIIGVETFFGRNVGKTRILDALTTLAFDTQRRAKFFYYRTGKLFADDPRRRLRAAATGGLLGGRNGFRPVHAQQFPPLGGRFQQRRPSQPLGSMRCGRQRSALFCA